MNEHDPDQTAIVRLSELTREETDELGLRVPTLTVLRGRELGRVYRLDAGSTIIGRSSSAPISLSEEGISRNHVEVLVRGIDDVALRDLGSTNGTFLNERRVDHRFRPLRDGDRVRLAGSVLLKFAFKDPLEESAQQLVYDQSVRDPLTGIFNKRYLNEELERAFTEAKRSGEALALVIFDLDHFKSVNDSFGHDVGDLVLRSVTEAARRSLRQDEVLARYGGEEFVVLLEGTSSAVAAKVAERLREAVERLQLDHKGAPIPVTASFGVAGLDQEDFAHAHALFVRADQRLYAAKRQGRNQVVSE
ncbi:MAG: GGDEF domain-containing protein [Alphaproteobacteria bacterium]|nr:GGDEF domain-containing protein [Alphaproteobacteria bacterium]MCB9796621.1 GGDEF domain-containing protein [Alphaproteobacteria bacterium]